MLQDRRRTALETGTRGGWTGDGLRLHPNDRDCSCYVNYLAWLDSMFSRLLQSFKPLHHPWYLSKGPKNFLLSDERPGSVKNIELKRARVL